MVAGLIVSEQLNHTNTCTGVVISWVWKGYMPPIKVTSLPVIKIEQYVNVVMMLEENSCRETHHVARET